MTVREIHNDIRDEVNCALEHDIGLHHASPEILDMLAERFRKIEELSGRADELIEQESNERKRVVDSAMALFKNAPIPNNAVIVKGEKGRNGGGDAGDGIFWDTGLVIMPGSAGRS